MQEKLPFIITIAIELLTLFTASIFIELPLFSVTILFIMGAIILKENSWALIGAFLINLSIMLYSESELQFAIVIGLLIGGSILEIFKTAIIDFNKGISSFKPTTTLNTVFALIGFAIGHYVLFQRCSISFDIDLIDLLWNHAFVFLCVSKEIDLILLNPIFYGMCTAILGQLIFDRSITRLIKRIIKAHVIFFLGGILIVVIGFVLSTAFTTLSPELTIFKEWFVFSLEYTFMGEPIIILVISSLYLLGLATLIGWGAKLNS